VPLVAGSAADDVRPRGLWRAWSCWGYSTLFGDKLRSMPLALRGVVVSGVLVAFKTSGSQAHAVRHTLYAVRSGRSTSEG
jgi:hypothetical protein